MSPGIAPARRWTIALGLFVIWCLFTFLLEGMLQTLLRPRALGLRTTYALVTNIGVGLVGSAVVLRRFYRDRTLTPDESGFPSAARSGASVLLASALGLGFLASQGLLAVDPVLLLNAFAQVLVVSLAEVAVCWAVCGSVAERLLTFSRPLSIAAAALVSSLLFGLYHFAHSPPFNQPAMVLFLTGLSLFTGVFFFATRSLLATAVFHNAFALRGVLPALEQSGAAEAFSTLVWPLVGLAALALAVVVLIHRTARTAWRAA